MSFTFKSVLTMHDFEIGAIAFSQKLFCVTKLAAEHDFCDTEIGTYDQQQISSQKHNKQENYYWWQ